VKPPDVQLQGGPANEKSPHTTLPTPNKKESLVSKIVSEDGVVDASALLLEAEQELDRSFRDQIFDALKSGYLKAKTAVANRNN